MSTSSEQILILFQQGIKPEEISEMLGLSLTDVLTILYGLGKLSVKNLDKSLNARKALNNGGAPTSLTSNIDTDSELSAEEIYKKYQHSIAKNLVTMAMATPTDDMPAAVIVKCGIYCREEATGRNDARAKRNNQSLLLSLAEMMVHAQNADNAVKASLGYQVIEVGKDITITAQVVAEVLDEKVA